MDIINIRRVTVNDAEALAAIGKRTFYDTFTGTCTEEDMQGFLEEYYNIKQVQSEIEDNNNYYFFAEVDGVVAGYLRFKEDYSSFPFMKKWKALELKRIYIDKPFQGAGVAQSLMNVIENFAIENNYDVIWLGVWEHNYKAKKFYQKQGYVNSGYTHDFPIGNTPQTDNWYWKFLIKP